MSLCDRPFLIQCEALALVAPHQEQDLTLPQGMVEVKILLILWWAIYLVSEKPDGVTTEHSLAKKVAKSM